MKTNAPSSSRSALLRMQHIHERLASGRKVTRTALAKELETSLRTVQRDIDSLRDAFRLPIAYDAVGHSFYYTRQVGAVRFGARSRQAELIPHGRDDGTAADFCLPLEREPHGHLEVICQRYHVRPEHVLAAIVGEALADAVRNSRLMDGIVRAARVLACQGEEVAA